MSHSKNIITTLILIVSLAPIRMSEADNNFDNGKMADATRDTYNVGLKKYREFHKLPNNESMLNFSDKTIENMLRDFIVHLKETHHPNSVTTWVNGPRKYLSINRKKISWDWLQQFYPDKVKRTGKRPYTTDEIGKMLEHENRPRNKAIIHILSSTGCRPGAIPELKMKHMKVMPLGCKRITLYNDYNQEYPDFLNPEANRALQNYLDERMSWGEKFTPDSPVIRDEVIETGEVKPISINGVKAIARKLSINAKITREKTGKRYDIMQNYGFRKRFATIIKKCKDIPTSNAERLLGHEYRLDSSYHSPSDEELFESYKKIMPELIINDEARKQVIIDEQNAELDKFKKQEIKIANLERLVGEIKAQKNEQIIKALREPKELTYYLASKSHGKTSEEAIDEKILCTPEALQMKRGQYFPGDGS